MKRAPILALALLGCSPAPPPPAVPAAPSATPVAASVDAGPPAIPPVALQPLPPNLGEWIDAYISAYGAHWGETAAFAGYVLVAQDGKPVFAKGYGKANRTTGAVADADTRFLLGSVTKQFTAVAILQLAERGALRVEDPLRKYLPDYPAIGDRITLHELLSHTSGIRSYTEDEALMKGAEKPHAVAEVLATFADKPLEFPPGTKFHYSNSNYFLLGLILEKVSGEKYGAYLQTHVLDPAGMTDTSTLDAPTNSNTAVGYTVEGDKLVPSKVDDASLPFAAGALRSTANDMVKWDRALAGNAVLTEDSKRRMFMPVRNDYAYGIGVASVEGHPVLEHNGGIDGFASDYARVPDQRLAVIAMSNDEFQPEGIVDAAVRMALSGRKIEPRQEQIAIPFDAPTVARFVGDYGLDPESRKKNEAQLPKALVDQIQKVVVVAKEGHLFLNVGPQPPLEMFLAGDGTLFSKHDGVTVAADPGKGPAAGLVLHQSTIEIRWNRVGAEKKKKTEKTK